MGIGNRRYYDAKNSNRPSTTVVEGTMTLDGAGNVTAKDFNGMESLIASIHTGLGEYTLDLQDSWIKLVRVNVSILKATDPGVRWYTKSFASTVSGLGGSRLVLQFTNLSSPAGATNPTSCDMHVELEFDGKSTT